MEKMKKQGKTRHGKSYEKEFGKGTKRSKIDQLLTKGMMVNYSNALREKRGKRDKTPQQMQPKGEKAKRNAQAKERTTEHIKNPTKGPLTQTILDSMLEARLERFREWQNQQKRAPAAKAADKAEKKAKKAAEKKAKKAAKKNGSQTIITKNGRMYEIPSNQPKTALYNTTDNRHAHLYNAVVLRNQST